ncbi:Phosphoglycolate phosphatase [Hyphomicrobiales bacterium]|nr:Phosphoglycolate phosphatase [Hyphomicrobiales bacterium]CAH1668243.1 Phosphoglycolate phosphatase [Hyphomicrobiales bacterium]
MHKLTPRVLAFDLDGTLADTAPDLIGTLNVILAREDLPPLPLEQARDLIGAGARALLERGLAASGRTASPQELERLFSDFVAHYSDHIADMSRLFPGVEASLKRFSDAGWVLAVCTNKFESQSIKLLELLGVADRFAAICGRDTFDVFKPDPRHLTATIARAGGDPATAVMVGDSLTDIRTARAAGIPVIAVPFGYTEVPVDQLGPDRIIHHFDELWDAVASLPARVDPSPSA